MNHFDEYYELLSAICYEKIKENLSLESAESLFSDNFIKRIKSDKTTRQHFIDFQKYYFNLINNPEEIQFKVFKQKYSLQGVTSDYLNKLNFERDKIIGFIVDDNLAELYFKYFHFQELETKAGNKTKSLGSFFTKLVHTYKPSEYTPVDMPMKDFFGLNNESYFVSMIVISRAFKKWANENGNIISEFKDLLIDYMAKENHMVIDKTKITDIKVMNTIFWSIANTMNEKKVKYVTRKT